MQMRGWMVDLVVLRSRNWSMRVVGGIAAAMRSERWPGAL